MIRIQRSAILGRSADFMFELVNDVGAYPDFMDGCERVEILQHSDDEMIATLYLSKAGVSQSFTTRNVLLRPHQIVMNLESGPFSRFGGGWTIKALNDQACKVSLELEFEINSKVAAKAIERLFKSVGDSLVDAVCRRAEQSV